MCVFYLHFWGLNDIKLAPSESVLKIALRAYTLEEMAINPLNCHDLEATESCSAAHMETFPPLRHRNGTMAE